jgi:hypothetical protein
LAGYGTVKYSTTRGGRKGKQRYVYDILFYYYALVELTKISTAVSLFGVKLITLHPDDPWCDVRISDGTGQ